MAASGFKLKSNSTIYLYCDVAISQCFGTQPLGLHAHKGLGVDRNFATRDCYERRDNSFNEEVLESSISLREPCVQQPAQRSQNAMMQKESIPQGRAAFQKPNCYCTRCTLFTSSCHIALLPAEIGLTPDALLRMRYPCTYFLSKYVRTNKLKISRG